MSNDEYQQQNVWKSIEQSKIENYKALYDILLYRIEEQIMKTLIDNNKTYLPKDYEQTKDTK